MPRIIVVNPNSSAEITANLDRSLDGIRALTSVQIDCIDIPESPPGIETQDHVDNAGLRFARIVETHAADGYITACYSDPGLYLAREKTQKPVIGIAESSFRYAMGLGQRFGIVSILDQSIPRHHRALRQQGLFDFLARDRAINIHMEDLGGDGVIDHIVRVGETLRDVDGAQAIILGCAGMARFQLPVQERLGLPVVDPVHAAVVRMLSMLMLNHSHTA